MAGIELNLMQERELGRLIDYERSTCSVEGSLVYRCAFPFRPDDDLQVELIRAGALARKTDEQRGIVVTITSSGYSYFPAKRQAAEKREAEKKHDSRLIGMSAGFAAACVVIGVLLGKFLS